jgi:cytochrome P450
VLAQSAAYFGKHQDRWNEMFANPERLEPAMEEILRLTSPAVPTRTVVSDEIEISGLAFPKGERLHAPLAAANRDPMYYPEPDEAIFDRPFKPHLAFGLGPHRCLGVHLARVEVRIAFEEWHRRMPTFSLDPVYEPHDHLGLAWGTDNVHLVFPPGKREDAGLILG